MRINLVDGHHEVPTLALSDFSTAGVSGIPSFNPREGDRRL
jgi:hypothetical protein